MKVVLFCGGFGLRIREYSESIPKPLVPIGHRPILWHVMKYYAHFGHKDFILALGYQGDVIRDYFLNYNEAASNVYAFAGGGRERPPVTSEIEDWDITFVDTGIDANIGQRLLSVREHISDDEIFLANYSDGLTDLDLNAHIRRFENSNADAAFLAVKPQLSYHTVEVSSDDTVTEIVPISLTNLWINGGFFVLRPEIFSHIKPGEELVMEPFQRLLSSKRLMANRHTGFWAAMDTLKDRENLETLIKNRQMPWAVWQTDDSGWDRNDCA